jgi:hypothetical protein
LRKAGSNSLINYTEITLRLIPATALVWYTDLSKLPEAFTIFGWFMIALFLVLYFLSSASIMATSSAVQTI